MNGIVVIYIRFSVWRIIKETSGMGAKSAGTIHIHIVVFGFMYCASKRRIFRTFRKALLHLLGRMFKPLADNALLLKLFHIFFSPITSIIRKQNAARQCQRKKSLGNVMAQSMTSTNMVYALKSKENKIKAVIIFHILIIY